MGHKPPAKPFYSLAIDAGGCPYDLRVNDCPVVSDSDGHSVKIDIPINQWLRSGSNVFTLALERWPHSIGTCLAEVRLGDVRDWPRPQPQVASLFRAAPPLPEGWSLPDAPPLWPPRQFKVHVYFNADLPYAPWRWDVTPPQLILQADRDAILAEVRRAWQALNTGDMAEVVELFSLRNAELGPARHQTREERTAEFRATMEDLMDPAEWVLAPLDEADLEYRSYADGRLVYLVDAITGESPLLFIDPGKELASYLDLYFFKETRGQWRIIR